MTERASGQLKAQSEMDRRRGFAKPRSEMTWPSFDRGQTSESVRILALTFLAIIAIIASPALLATDQPSTLLRADRARNPGGPLCLHGIGARIPSSRRLCPCLGRLVFCHRHRVCRYDAVRALGRGLCARCPDGRPTHRPVGRGMADRRLGRSQPHHSRSSRLRSNREPLFVRWRSRWRFDVGHYGRISRGICCGGSAASVVQGEIPAYGATGRHSGRPSRGWDLHLRSRVLRP